MPRLCLLATVLVVLFPLQESLARESPAQESFAQLAPDTASAPAGRGLVVGVADTPPFAIKGEDGSWQGIGVDLWRQLADTLNATYDFREVRSDRLLAGVADGSLDLALANVTGAGEQQVDFSHIYYSSTLGVAGSSRRSLWTIVKGIFSMRFLWIALSLSVLLLIVGFFIWLVERKANPDHFGGDGSTLRGIGAGFWWSGVTMTTIGYGDKAPATFGGRALALLWMLIAMGITASLTATVVSVVGIGHSGSIDVPEDLRDMKVGSVAGSDEEAYLKQQNLAYQEFSSPREGLQALQDDQIDAFVGSAPVLRYLVNENANLSVNVKAANAEPQRYAFALPSNSALREPLNRVLLKTINASAWRSLLKRYLPDQGQQR